MADRSWYECVATGEGDGVCYGRLWYAKRTEEGTRVTDGKSALTLPPEKAKALLRVIGRCTPEAGWVLNETWKELK